MDWLAFVAAGKVGVPLGGLAGMAMESSRFSNKPESWLRPVRLARAKLEIICNRLDRYSYARAMLAKWSSRVFRVLRVRFPDPDKLDTDGTEDTVGIAHRV